MGDGKVSKTNYLTSLAAEMYGILGTLTTLMLMCRHNGSMELQNGKIVVTTNNKEIVKWVIGENTQSNISGTWVLEYNLWNTSPSR